VTPTSTPPPAPEAPRPAALCPLCQGGLVRLRDAYRCGRCSFVICVGCEAVAVGPGAD
jgi:hypothetical protein